MVRDLGDWSTAELASAAAENVQAQMRVECNLLRIAAAWAEKHPGDGLPLDVQLDNGADERNLMIAGDGCPDIAEGAVADLAIQIRRTVWQTKGLIEDAVGLKYRFPLLWARVEAGNVPAWQARQVVEAAEALTIDQAGHIDRCITPHLGNIGGGRLKNLLDAEILRVDAAAREQAAKEALRQREVRFGRTDHDNITQMTAGLPAVDACRSEAGINRLADILADRAAGGDLPAGVPVHGATTKDHWRTVALTLCTSNPVLAAQLLAEERQPDLFTGVFAHADQRHGPTHRDQVDQDADPVRERLVADVIKQIDPTKLLPNVTLHVHINAEAFLKPDEDHIARVEDIGPTLLTTIRTWLGDGAIIRLQPILDPDHISPVDRYETPDRMRDALLARTPASIFPWTGSLNRRNDLDHTTPYVPPPSGPPGQTGLHNLGPLARREHRAKTIGHMIFRQPDPGTYVCKDRYGQVLIINDTGTHRVGNLNNCQLAWDVWQSADRQQHLHALDVA